ncbi:MULTISPECIES: LysR family transcriptional regulator [unclassified Sinorhizobium]|uniref:LysR family transcriptional regulator n=1 Tax=unclassified Sinorhizobium TaxID=2613772 RepID=UPI0024C38C16|nr:MULTISPECIES: LysR family transcriptional regulator [unclassified Sinorhizobium]MDK1376502.1 LysR substrate-binding domain-containing protein [Sinorhizobium sp. 6-70]MDK1481943.1 LysR substrate-binding domain-containing protein [Sinorhizobium sp. 6-117]
MDLRWLEDLEALAEELNFSRAAAQRNVTQPAFGRRIRSLEDWCGIELFDRKTHRIRLTPAGEIMLAAAKDVVHRLDRARREIDDILSEANTLTIASTHALSFTFFPDWIRSLGPEAIQIPIHLLADNMVACERMMRDERAQFLLCHYHPQTEIRLDADEFLFEPVGTDALVPIAKRGPDGLPVHRLTMDREDPVPLLSFDDRSGMGRIISAALPNYGELHATTVFTSHLAVVLRKLALEGMGIAWSPESILKDDLAPSGGLSVVGGDEWRIPVTVILLRPRRKLSKLAEHFWEEARSRRSGSAL